ncbi:mercuric transport protein MerTP [Ancylomarina longa]|uniref:Mercuric transport protein MerT n=1 Tax=Ancylomarina longa TaxID=2487017 RepID=A0A434AFM2_9BACT|nr:mercuric transport protein MerTP [Ancylomarina longa]RUT73115.1 mercuric transport protein MerTP [Ancylomarina longa]
MKTKSNKALVGSGIITAIAASLCCITPVLALIAGTSGIASSFSWMEPFRPYLMGFTILVLGFAWYQKLKPRTLEEIECACEKDEKPSFWQSKKFLGIITVFAALMLAFPYYSPVFYPKNKHEVITVNTADIQTIKLDIEGMTCDACDSHVAYAAQEVDGVIEAKADHKTGTAEVKFDKSKTSAETIIQSIDKTSYKVVGEN